MTLVAPGCAPAAPAKPPAAPISHLPASIAARIDAVMLRALEHQRLPGVSLAIGRRDGTILYARGYGFRNLAHHESVDEDTVYNIASITKQFTAVAILQLAQNHRLTLDDRLSKYLPNIPFANDVSLRELMNHTSGIPDYFCLAGYQPGMSATDIAGLAGRQPLHFRPGTAYEYSNTNYVLLGTVVENVSGSTYIDLVRRRLFEAAHMDSSRGGEVPGDGPDDAIGYTLDDDVLEPVSASAADLAFGAGAIDSTSVDLVRWNAALFSGRLLNGSQLHQLLAARRYQPGTTVRYAFGLYEGRVSGDRELYHRGRNAGYGGIDATFPDDDMTIAILANNENLAPMHLVDELYALVMPARQIARTASAGDDLPVDRTAAARAKLWLERLSSGRIDRNELTPDASRRYSAAAVRSLSGRLATFGPLQKLTLLEKDSRCAGWNYTYRAVFNNAIVEYRFGVNRGDKVWNLALDRED